MPFITWTEELSTGVPEIDRQHAGLGSILERLHGALASQAEYATVEGLLAQLVVDAREHFRCEEQWMERAKYPWLADHKLEHEGLLLQVSLFHEHFVMGELPLSAPLLQVLKGWLTDHIAQRDRSFRSFLSRSEPPRTLPVPGSH